MKRTFVLPLSLLTLLVRAAPTVPQTGCGGCYAGGTVSDVVVTPPTGCLAVTAGAIDSCDGDYEITIANSCADDLTLGSLVVAAGATISINNTNLCEDLTCSLEGSLGSTAITIEWVVVPDE